MAMVLASALTFGFVHIIYGNWVSVGLSAIGGVLFSITYIQTGHCWPPASSTPSSAIFCSPSAWVDTSSTWRAESSARARARRPINKLRHPLVACLR
jgi:hypothetical protein